MGLAKTFLAIGISVIFVIFIAYGLHVFYELPDYNYNACYNEYDCYVMFNECNPSYNMTSEEIDKAIPLKEDYGCREKIEQSEEYLKCEDDRQKCEDEALRTSDRYKTERNSFFILLIIGLAAVIAGIYLSKLEGVGSGLIGGGILVIVWSLIYTARYWLTLSKYFKLVALGVVLGLLFYLGYKKLDKATAKPKSKKKVKIKKSKRK